MGKKIRKELTKNEKERLEKFEKVSKSLEDKGYERHDLLTDAKKASTIGYLLPLPFVIIFSIIYFLLGNSFVFDDIVDNIILFIFLSFCSLVVHEGIHGLTHAIFAKNHFKDISFGIIWDQVTPYCTCNSYEKKYQYIIACLMPFFILGIVLGIVSSFINSTLIYLITIVNIFGTSGDMIVVLLVLKNKSKKKDVLYIDHPCEVGVVMFDK